jgi:hypothetical protein
LFVALIFFKIALAGGFGIALLMLFATRNLLARTERQRLEAASHNLRLCQIDLSSWRPRAQVLPASHSRLVSS